jgi:hypothetical protein
MTAINPDEDSATGGSPVLPVRPGPRPQTTSWAPHIQQDQIAPAGMQAMLAQRVFALPEVEERPGTVAHPAERAIWLRDQIPAAPGDMFLGHREIGHFHPWDGSLHIVLDPTSPRPRSPQDGPKSIPSPWPGSPPATGSCSTAPATNRKQAPSSA